MTKLWGLWHAEVLELFAAGVETFPAVALLAWFSCVLLDPGRACILIERLA